MKKLAIITARGGSKRIPRKNLKDFLGKPIISYSIEAALNSKLFDEVMVSTDDAEIAEVAKKYGAIVPFIRSDKNSDDHSTTADVLLEVITSYQNRGRFFDYFCCIYPTAPFVSEEKLKNSFSILENSSNLDVILPVVKFGFPIQRALKVENDLLSMFEPNHMNTRSQDLAEAFHDAGQFYWLKTDAFMDRGTVYSGKMSPFVLSELEVQDIDNPVDWSLAELKYKMLKKMS